MAFKLTGEIDDTAYSFLLADGEYELGSARRADLRVEHPAVSRAHAVLRVADALLEVEDRGSKNGVLVNENRVSVSAVHDGDTLGLGSCRFLVQSVDDTDAEIGIRTSLKTERGSTVERPTTITGDEFTPVDRLLVDVAVQLGELILTPEPRIQTAMTAFIRLVGARAAAVYEWSSDDKTICHHLAGDPAFLPDRDEFEMTRPDASDAVLTVAEHRDQSTSTLAVVGATLDASLCKPLMGHLLRMICFAEKPDDQIATKSDVERSLVFPASHVPGTSPAMTAIYEEIRLLVTGDLPVLVVGSTGVGKEHVARILHLSSPRSNGPFVAVNCAAIPADLLESELFGIEKGVATGVNARIGKLQQAQGGVLFLDEVGDMLLGLQAKLLRAVEELEVHPLGARDPVPIDVRIVSATNVSPQTLLNDRGFRQDLYFRLAGFTLRIPDLAERRTDIPVLVERFVQVFSREVHKEIKGVTVKALQKLSAAPWPGNVRELQHEVRRLVYCCPPRGAIDSSMLSPSVTATDTMTTERTLVDQNGDIDLKGQVAELERHLVKRALEQANGNKSEAARRLGLTRNGLATKMGRLGMNG